MTTRNRTAARAAEGITIGHITRGTPSGSRVPSPHPARGFREE
ncbi:hypothetical protein [Embleya scabrispora]|nr:hypothetical protein [Embleya scabrispora]